MAEATRQSIQAMIQYIATSLVEDPSIWEPLLAELGRTDVVTPQLPGFGCPTPDGFAATKEDYVVMELTVRPDDLGKVIGKNGQTARAMRTLVNAAASRAGEKIIFEIRE